MKPLRCEDIAHAAQGEPADQRGGGLLHHCLHGDRDKHSGIHASQKVKAKQNSWSRSVCGGVETARARRV